MTYTLTDIDDYQNKLTDEQKTVLIKHCNKYQIEPNICAWYDDDDDDFHDDWMENANYSLDEADDLFNDNPDEFLQFDDMQIIRLAL